MIPLDPKASAVLGKIREWQEKRKNSPNVPELARELDMCPSNVLYWLYDLQDKGYVDLEHSERRLVIVPLYWE